MANSSNEIKELRQCVLWSLTLSGILHLNGEGPFMASSS